MSARPGEVVVVGGGMIGSAIAWRLAEAGCPVTVLERDPADAAPPSAAAWGAGGMLAPVSEADFQPREELALGRESLRRYPEWVAALESASGASVGYRAEGTLVVALDRDDAAWLERQYEHQRALGLPVEWLTATGAREREAHLASAVVAAVHVPGDHQVDARRMWRALRAAIAARGGRVRTGVEVTRVVAENGAVRGVEVVEDGAAGRIEARTVVAAGGAWTKLLLRASLPPEAVPPVRPVKGQLLALEASELLRLEHVVRSRRVYLVPKADGRLLVGATMEEAGFDRRPTAGAVLELLRDAWEAVPGIHDLPLLETWAGLRPASRDGAPVLGRTPVEGLHVATGHYRDGVLLAPITAHLMTELLLEGREPPLMAPFRLERFHTRSSR